MSASLEVEVLDVDVDEPVPEVVPVVPVVPVEDDVPDPASEVDVDVVEPEPESESEELVLELVLELEVLDELDDDEVKAPSYAYTFKRLEPPQYSVELPAQVMVQPSEAGAPSLKNSFAQ